MSQRTQALIFATFGWLTATILGIGIIFIGWPPVLIFVVPVFGGLLFLLAFEVVLWRLGRRGGTYAEIRRQHAAGGS